MIDDWGCIGGSGGAIIVGARIIGVPWVIEPRADDVGTDWRIDDVVERILLVIACADVVP